MSPASGMPDLRTRPELYRSMFGALDSGFCIVEVDLRAPVAGGATRIDYRVVDANAAFYRETGFPEAIFGQWLREAAPSLEEHWFDIYGSVVRTREPARFEQGSDLLGRWFSVYAFPVGEPADGLVAILFSDISDRRAAQAELKELNRDLESRVAQRTAERDRLWQRSRDLFGVADSDGVWQSVNPAWTAVLGWDARDIVGRTSEWMEHPEDKARTREEVARLAAGSETIAFENRFRAKDGSYRSLSWTAVPEGGLLFTVARDVTVERAHAAELRAAQEALRQSQKMEAVGQLTGGLAHDFNNILAGIAGSLELMQTRLSQGRIGEITRYLVAARGATQRAASLTHRLLAFSRRQTLEPAVTDLNRLVAGMEDLIAGTVGPAIDVETVAGAGLWTTLVDANQLENALLNLCINARDAMPEGGRIVVETANRWLDERTSRERDLPPGQYVSLCVSDNGIGMTPDIVERAFDPFFTTKPQGQGTGLGLSMIYGFARQSGGQVRIESEPGKGTTVCIYLPRHASESGAPGDIAIEEPAPPAGAGLPVLVVDDEPLVRMVVVDILAELGFQAVEAEDGIRAMDVLGSEAPLSLLITDVGLPNGMNGRQVAEAARQLRPDLPVLFITGYAENAVLSHGHLEAGMQIATKPFDVERLKRRIVDLIASRL
jgi:PAS domain S-box-containing protein